MSLSEKAKGSLALLGLAFSYALFGVFTRFLSQDFALFQQVYIRLFIAIVLGAALFRGQPGRITLKTLPRSDLRLFFLRAVLTYALGVIPFIYAVTHTTLANVAFIGALPVSVFWGVVLFGEKLTLARATLIAVALVGVAVISVNDLSAISQWGKAEACALVATMFFVLGASLVKKQSPGLPESALTQYFMITGCLVCFAGSVLAGETLSFVPSYTNMGTSVVAAALITLNVILANYGFARVPAMVGGNILTSEIAFTLTLGYMVYGEIPTLRAVVGGSLILLSVGLLAYLESRTKPEELR